MFLDAFGDELEKCAIFGFSKREKLEKAYVRGYNRWADTQNQNLDLLNADLARVGYKMYGRGLSELKPDEWQKAYDATQALPRWKQFHDTSFAEYNELATRLNKTAAPHVTAIVRNQAGRKGWLRGNVKERFIRSRTLQRMAKKASAVKKTVTIDGLTMRIECEKGDTRFKGKPHERVMKDSYGHMPGTYGKGADGEAIDIYVNPDLAKGDVIDKVYKVHQLKKGTGEFDEDKYMVGYDSAADAKKAFLRNMPSWAFGSMSSMTREKFGKLVGQTSSR